MPAGPDLGPHPAGGHLQHVVAGVVAVGVVDLLEVVEVDEEGADLVAGARAGVLERALQQAFGLGAVGQPGERVVRGAVLKLALQPLALADRVGEQLDRGVHGRAEPARRRPAHLGRLQVAGRQVLDGRQHLAQVGDGVVETGGGDRRLARPAHRHRLELALAQALGAVRHRAEPAPDQAAEGDEHAERDRDQRRRRRPR